MGRNWSEKTGVDWFLSRQRERKTTAGRQYLVWEYNLLSFEKQMEIREGIEGTRDPCGLIF